MNKPRQVMAVEEHHDAATMLAELVRWPGCKVVAHDGVHALARLQPRSTLVHRGR
ncbi:hypothetical protein OU994_08045 [Pseudoduganella sp. SL102]|uniref:hypothetical protein n=1 Tax=Pseudoduganella sp. SL102 TaxID=2995154 RepID=UPI00248AFDCA|nr:hypothetical protein [Pseudoduganella sp. SL102]WBS04222.1 hypothetical protein OU994_08045 [Pseudoduganella sp. SL102]